MEKSLQRFLRYQRSNGHTPKTLTYHEQTNGAFINYLKAKDEATDIEDLDS